MKKKKTYGGAALEGDLKEPGAFTLSPFETGTGAAAAVPASELKIASQFVKSSNYNNKTGTYTAASKINWRWTDFETFEGVEGSLERAFLGLSLVGLMMSGSYQNKQYNEHIVYLT